MAIAPILLSDGALDIQDDGPVLIGVRCTSCGTVAFPRSSICSSCMSETLVDEPMPSCGNLYSWTSVHVGSPRMNKPITIGYVDLQNGVRVFSHLVARNRALEVDQPVELSVAIVGRTEEGNPIQTFVFVPAERRQ